jgi:hypothetical protein
MRRLWIIIGFLLLALPSWAGNVTIKKAQLINMGSEYPYLKVELDGLFFPRLKEALLGGVSIPIDYTVTIKKPRSVLWDPKLWKGVYCRVIKYNLLTETFTIKDPPELEREFSDFQRFSQESLVFLMPLPPKPLKVKGAYVEVKAHRMYESHFFPLDFISHLLFPSPSDFQTNKMRVKAHK